MDADNLWRFILSSKVAESCRVRIGKPFLAKNWNEFESGLQKLPLHAYLRGNKKLNPSQIKVTTSHSHLYHRYVRRVLDATLLFNCLSHISLLSYFMTL